MVRHIQNRPERTEQLCMQAAGTVLPQPDDTEQLAAWYAHRTTVAELNPLQDAVNFLLSHKTCKHRELVGCLAVYAVP